MAATSTWAQSKSKRAIDITTATVALAAATPVLLAASAAIYVSSRGPVLFRQQRIGLNDVPFEVLKLRTMTVARSETKSANETSRVTPVGKVLRQLGIDELPQLVSVVLGDMSLVGPRPLLPEYLPYYSPEERLRHSVRPGITGLAQTSGRNSVAWTTKLGLDVEYATRASAKMDALILVRTVRQIFNATQTNVSADQVAVRLDDERSAA